MNNYYIQKKPFSIPVPDDKIIREHFGLASIFCGDFSFAHMVAPSGWSEPAQVPEFDEITFIISGKKQFEIDGGIIMLEAGQSICIKKGTRVRYSNPFHEKCEYVSVCIPAFSVDRVHRESK
ncbi:MAG: cupin domain-containing protein [Ignavibacteriales bacterium]|nr:cupin domain-containing protein [Ignavibacteriales bacterium]MCF8316448.1 cupin domain-containing protein [Ignavibacteriales bacterium]MCF8437928.1 cupin domain-containing protein [Ignavibacteriales bacterium]